MTLKSRQGRQMWFGVHVAQRVYHAMMGKGADRRSAVWCAQTAGHAVLRHYQLAPYGRISRRADVKAGQHVILQIRGKNVTIPAIKRGGTINVGSGGYLTVQVEENLESIRSDVPVDPDNPFLWWEHPGLMATVHGGRP